MPFVFNVDCDCGSMFNGQIDQEQNHFLDNTRLPQYFAKDAEHQSSQPCFSTRYFPINIVLYVFDGHVVSEGQVSSQRSTRTSISSEFLLLHLFSES